MTSPTHDLAQKPRLAAHTPTPWLLHHQNLNEQTGDGINYSIQTEGLGPVIALIVEAVENPQQQKIDLSFIIRAANARDNMLAALKLIIFNAASLDEARSYAKSAYDKAKGDT